MVRGSIRGIIDRMCLSGRAESIVVVEREAMWESIRWGNLMDKGLENT